MAKGREYRAPLTVGSAHRFTQMRTQINTDIYFNVIFMEIDKVYEKRILLPFLWIWLPVYALVVLIKETFFAE